MSKFLQFSWATPENLSVSNCSVTILGNKNVYGQILHKSRSTN